MVKEKMSRSFIPIAEDYMKSGMFDAAIAVLKEGLQTYPNYLGARVSLGKAYLEKGMIHEAIREFESVVQLSPDNLFAHRKLVTLYKDLGRFDDAIRGCETLLMFNPKDKETAELLSNLMVEKIGGGAETGESAEKAEPLSPIHQEGVRIDFTSSWEVETEKEPEPEKDKVDEELITETMGDLYVAQGEVGKGMDIYRRILEKEPENVSVREKLCGSSIPSSDSKKERQIEQLQDFLEMVQKNKR